RPRVDARLAAHCTVHLRDDGRRDLDAIDPAHVSGGDKPAQIADDSTAKSNQQGAPVCAELEQPRGEALDAFQALRGLTRRDKNALYVPDAALLLKLFPPAFPERAFRQDEDGRIAQLGV